MSQPTPMSQPIRMCREGALRGYFKGSAPKPWLNKGIGSLVVAALLLLVSVSLFSGSGSWSWGCGVVFAVPGILLSLRGGIRFWQSHSAHRQHLLEAASGPSDDEVQAWLDQGLAQVKDRSLRALGLSDDELVSDLLAIVAPVLWSTEGIEESDLLFRKGGDGCARFGVYSVAIIALTMRHLGVFSCKYNFVRGEVGSERTCEYHYRDIVSVSTGEEKTSLVLPSGEKLVAAQEFRVSIPSGEAIRITVDAAEIRRLVGADALPSSGAERAVRAIRAMLRQKKD